jgi:formylglycine-generating enzyme required for sulfatase activity/dienelactone hydrolase
VIAAAAAAVLVAGYGWKRTTDRSRTRTEDIPEMARLIGQERFAEAKALFDHAERVLGNDSALAAIRGQIIASMQVAVTPASARVEYQAYNDTSGTWTPLARSAGDTAHLPRGAKRWRATAAGFDTLLAASPRVPPALELTLDSAGSLPVGMVRIPGGRATAWITGLDPIEGMPLDSYLIDRYEVSNRAFKAFVDSGGYGNRAYWKYPFNGNGTTLTWKEAMSRFVDATGRPGPATWDLGDYPRGEGDFPVSGVSWYEAAAYAEFRQKSLPTVYNWVHAASTGMPEFIIPRSNFGGKGPAPRGSLLGESEFGLFDMAGNVREWQYNSSGEGRFALGGAWNDPTYMFTYAAVRDPLDRAPGNGFRLAEYRDGREPADAARDLPLAHRDYSEEKPVDDAAFRLILNQFSYDPTPLNAKSESVTDSTGWRHEVVSFDAAYGGDRVLAHLYLPTDHPPPFQTVVWYPGSGAIVARHFNADNEPWLVRSGYAYVVPIYWGTYERNAGVTSTWPTPTHRYVEQVTRQVKDFRRTVDYLVTRPEFDLAKLAYTGFSWGGRMGVLINAIEPRIKVAVLADGGLAAGRALPEVDQINFAPRIRIPVLMLNGKFDAIEPYESAQQPLFRMLGAPPDQKKHVVWNAAHGTYPQNEAQREILAWLERFLGPVGR